jgi:hypothetical protein
MRNNLNIKEQVSKIICSFILAKNVNQKETKV